MEGQINQPMYAQQGSMPVGQWQYHPSYYSLSSLSQIHERLYAGGPGGFFFYDLAYQSLEIISPKQGLYSNSVALLQPIEEFDLLLLAFSDGTIQFFDGRAFTTLPDVRQADILGNKEPLHAFEYKGRVYLGYGFGLVSIGRIGNEFRVLESVQNLVATGDQLAVEKVVALEDTLYAQTRQGIFRAPLNSNLLDFQSWANWKQQTQLNLWKDSILTVQDSLVYLYKQGKQSQVMRLPQEDLIELTISRGELLAITKHSQGNQVWQAQGDGWNLLAEPNTIRQVADVERLASGSWALADRAYHGLVLGEPENWNTLVPEAPFSFQGFKVSHHRDSLYLTSGGYATNTSPNYNGRGFYAYKNGTWNIYSFLPGIESTPFFLDAIDVEYIEQSQTLFVSSYGQGLFGFREDTVLHYTYTNSPLTQVANVPETRLTGLAQDLQGTLWICDYYPNNGQNANSIFSLSPEGEWASYAYPGMDNKGPNMYIEDVMVDEQNHKWMRVLPARTSREGQSLTLWVMDETQNRHINLTTANGLPDGKVYSMATDREGAVWIGTSQGLAVFYSTFAIFEEPQASKPIFEGRPVLENHTVTALEVDGANRKWCGTNDAGVWLLNENATESVYYFNQENSPLPSNQILDISINHQTGEVFFLTGAGLVSFRAGATDVPFEEDQVKVFPNPVRPGYEGMVAINGLPANARIKITDASGRLAHEDFAQGAQLTWNLSNYQGQSVSTGIYYIYAAQEDGTETFLGKFAVVREN